MMAEQILVVSTEELKKRYNFQGYFPLNSSEVAEFFDSIKIIPMERNLAEHDPSHKQLVAYSVVKCEDLFLAYLRGKQQGEERLRGNRSVGFGGHINSGDQAHLFLDDRFKVAAFREVDEEIDIQEKFDLRLAGLLNDDSNDVGKVHLGLVYVAALSNQDVKKREKSITQMSFATAEDLKNETEQFETWSRILIDNLDKL